MDHIINETRYAMIEITHTIAEIKYAEFYCVVSMRIKTLDV